MHNTHWFNLVSIFKFLFIKTSALFARRQSLLSLALYPIHLSQTFSLVPEEIAEANMTNKSHVDFVRVMNQVPHRTLSHPTLPETT